MNGQMSIPICVVALTALSLFFGSCSGPSDEPVSGTELDLIRLHKTAKQLRETGWVNLSSPMSDYYLARGWSKPYSPAEGAAAETAAVAQEAVFRYNVLRSADRWLVFSVKPQGKHGGPAFQQVEVFIGGEKAEAFEISGDSFVERQVYIHKDKQQPGANEVLFKFSVFTHNEDFLSIRKNRHLKFPHPGVAAYFSEFRIYPGDQAGPMRLTRDEINTFELGADGMSLRQWPNSELAFAFEIRKGTVLALDGAVQAAERGVSDRVSVKVQARSDDKPEWRGVWVQEFEISPRESSHPFEANIGLDELTGDLYELRIGVYASNIFSQTSVDWRRIRLNITKEVETSGGAAVESERAPVRLGDKVKNVVIIILDAARPDHFKCFNDDAVETAPNIERLAAKSVRFKSAIAAAPYTIASISTLFSGLNPETHGVRSLPREDDDDKETPEEQEAETAGNQDKAGRNKKVLAEAFPKDIENLPRAFKRSGFFTLTLAGSKFIKREFGLTRDCDEVVYLRKVEDIRDQITTMDLEAMKEGVAKAAASGKPVFLYAHFLPPHWPYRPPQPYNNKFIQKPKFKYTRLWQLKELLDHRMFAEAGEDIETHHQRYLNNMYYADFVTQYLLDLLKEHGLYDNSLIFITSDHGEAFAEHGQIGHNTSVYEEMIAVPLIAWYPGVKPAMVEQQVGLIDFFPTLVELFDLDAETSAFQGRSIAPLLVGGTLEPADYYYARAVGTNLIFTLRGERLKYVHDDFHEALFDLTKDPGEKNNIIGEHPVLAAYLRQRALMMIAYNSGLRGEGGEEFTLDPEDAEDLRGIGYLQ